MSRQDIADRLGVKLATVKGYANFPPPDVVVGRNQGWAPATIEAWIAARESRRTASAPCPHSRVFSLDSYPPVLTCQDCGADVSPDR